MVGLGKVAVNEVATVDSIAPTDCRSAGVEVVPDVTVRTAGMACVAEAPVPVTVSVEVPVGVVGAVVIVIVDIPPTLTIAGLKEVDAPAGNPDTVSATFCAVPLVTVVEIELVTICPGVTETDDGLAVRDKSFPIGALAWQARVPLSVHVLPASGWKCQS